MTRNEAVAIVKQQLGFRTNLDETIVTNMQLAQKQLEMGPTLPWFLLSEYSTISTSASEPRLPLPTDFLRMHEESDVLLLNEEDDEVVLVKDVESVLRGNYFNADAAQPEAYAIVGNNLVLFPTPDASYYVKLRYYQRDVTLSSNVTNGFLTWCPYVLIGKAGGLVASALRDSAAQGIFRGLENEGRLALAAMETARQESGGTPQMGGPE
jgi:hypothetical protein